MDPLFLTALVSVIGSVSGIAGVLIGSRIAANAADRASKSAERQHFRELGMQFAMVNFECCVKMAERASDNRGIDCSIPPLRSFVIQGLKVMDVVSDPNLSTKAMIKKIAECEDFADAITRAAMAR
ncbi:hypothetical protein ACFQY0_21135 [Haloferula chungangensis]|uniref:Uncharacterized protein n=1 Tax=Haloferula chungangensis TaxID=1048331 RepID=A0ABW2LEG0_9BACT